MSNSQKIEGIVAKVNEFVGKYTDSSQRIKQEDVELQVDSNPVKCSIVCIFCKEKIRVTTDGKLSISIFNYERHLKTKHEGFNKTKKTSEKDSMSRWLSQTGSKNNENFCDKSISLESDDDSPSCSTIGSKNA